MSISHIRHQTSDIRHAPAFSTALLILLAQQSTTTPPPAASGGMSMALWGMILIGVAILLFSLELFVPSGMILGIGGMVSLVAGIVCLFIQSQELGLIGIVVSLIGLPIFFVMAIRVWPTTPIARFLTLGNPRGDDADGEGAGKPREATDRSAMVGKVGQAQTGLRPVGTCVIDGDRHECLAESGVIEAGSRVRVVHADGMQIKVRAVE
ncbi:MAG: hypothetical protein GC164_00205 [Phycisphaera sp.]|nr:hypothetical protein [Phycisphaera sp.]